MYRISTELISVCDYLAMCYDLCIEDTFYIDLDQQRLAFVFVHVI